MARSALWPLLALPLALALTPAPARADLPPPEGTRFVPYRFRVEGIAKFSDYAIIAYPYSTSNGAPTREHTLAEDGTWLDLGRRSAPPELYAVRREAYAEFRKTYLADPQDLGPNPAIEDFLAKAVKCDLRPNPRFTLPDDDRRDAISEAFLAEKVDGASCHLSVVKPMATNEPAASSEGSQPAQKGGGCAGCAQSSGAPVSDAALTLLLVSVLSAARRRSK